MTRPASGRSLTAGAHVLNGWGAARGLWAGLLVVVVVVAAACSPPPPPPTLSVVDVAAGQRHTCAIISDGSVMCWGDNHYGQLGNGTTTDSSSPVSVVGVPAARSIAAGAVFTCASLGDGTARCWGNGTHGQLGNGTNSTAHTTPVAVSGLTGVTEVSAGDFHVCAVLADGSGRCWGKNGRGGLGDGSTNDSNVPVSVVGLVDATSVSAAVDNTSCALVADGSIRCWGFNGQGQLGTGASVLSSPVPLTVANITDAIAVGAGLNHVCAVLADHTVRCWGGNGSGQLGNGSVNYGEITPQVVSGLSDAVEIDGGSDFSCAVTLDGGTFCWGSNESGRLGDGTAADSAVPVPVVGIAEGSTLSSFRAHSCLISNGLSVSCWGRNDTGQLGDQTTNDSSVPVEVIGLP